MAEELCFIHDGRCFVSRMGTFAGVMAGLHCFKRCLGSSMMFLLSMRWRM